MARDLELLRRAGAHYERLRDACNTPLATSSLEDLVLNFFHGSDYGDGYNFAYLRHTVVSIGATDLQLQGAIDHLIAAGQLVDLGPPDGAGEALFARQYRPAVAYDGRLEQLCLSFFATSSNDDMAIAAAPTAGHSLTDFLQWSSGVGSSEEERREAVATLEAEGLIYSTIDDEHFKATIGLGDLSLF